MKVFILAAGFGKRLRPFTEKLPKPLIKIKKKPLIYWKPQIESSVSNRVSALIPVVLL